MRLHRLFWMSIKYIRDLRILVSMLSPVWKRRNLHLGTMKNTYYKGSLPALLARVKLH
jgi:hypothetical protein